MVLVSAKHGRISCMCESTTRHRQAEEQTSDSTNTEPTSTCVVGQLFQRQDQDIISRHSQVGKRSMNRNLPGCKETGHCIKKRYFVSNYVAHLCDWVFKSWWIMMLHLRKIFRRQPQGSEALLHLQCSEACLRKSVYQTFQYSPQDSSILFPCAFSKP